MKSLRDLGWEDGRTVAIEYRYGSNDAGRLARIEPIAPPEKTADVVGTEGGALRVVMNGKSTKI